ncbi:MAG TPA: diguanylate cyclase, partial [Candidatus Obscuribacterales bacterium]
AVDIILSKELNTFLRNLEISESGLAFIVDDDNYLIASSTPEPTTVGSGTETYLLAANHSENPIIRQSVSHLLTEFETIAGVPSMRSDFRYDGDRYHLEVLSFNDDYGLDWLVVVVVPEADFMAHLHQNMRVAIALSIVALLFTIVCGYLITQWLTRPLHHLNQQAKEMARGEWQNFVPLDRGDVIGDLSRSFTTMANQLQSSFHLLEDRIEERTVELMELNQELQRLANIDGLTQIANRRFFDHTLEQEWHRLGIAQKPLSLIFCDVDFFKNYNDTYGHQIGDECLQKIAKLLTQSVRASTDLVARYGGEEFAIILPEADETAALRVAQAIAQKLAALAIPHGASERGLVTLSMGLATVTPAERHRLRSLLTAADLALYTAKAQGRNQVFLASALPLETSPLRL